MTSLRASSAAESPPPHPSGGRLWADNGGLVMLVFASFVVCGLLMPLIYGLAAFHGAYHRMMKIAILEHVAFNSLANLFVMLSAIGLTGRFDQKLSGVFQRTIVAHGALAFFTLIARHYYSIPMLLVGAPASALLGGGVVIVRQAMGRIRVGVLGPWHPLMDDHGLACERLAKPTAAIRPYQLLLITFGGELPAAWAQTLSRGLLAGKRVRHVAEYLEEARGVVDADRFELDHLPVAGVISYRTVKRLFDVFFVIASLPLALPMVALASLGILLTMGRPVFFIQTRVGLGGRVFSMFKLRTMRADSGGAEAMATAREDARITPLGRVLRRFHIDELPQLWNVLVGDMSLIGPRPEQPALAESYSKDVPAFAFRQIVRPGITGWAQVRAEYAADLAESQVKLGFDLFYLKHFSLALDMQIFARTFWTLLSGGGVR